MRRRNLNLLYFTLFWVLADPGPEVRELLAPWFGLEGLLAGALEGLVCPALLGPSFAMFEAPECKIVFELLLAEPILCWEPSAPPEMVLLLLFMIL